MISISVIMNGRPAVFAVVSINKMKSLLQKGYHVVPYIQSPANKA